jgi:hypothetical protein
MNFASDKEIHRLAETGVDLPLHRAALDFVVSNERRRRGEGTFDHAIAFWLGPKWKCCARINFPTSIQGSPANHRYSAEHVAHVHGLSTRITDLRRVAILIKKYEPFREWDVVNVALARHSAQAALTEP